MKFLRLTPLLLIVAGCRNPAPGYTPVPPPDVPTISLDSVKDAKDLMPLAVGNHWTYASRTQSFDKADKPRPEFRTKVDIDIAARWPNGTGVLMVTQNGNIVDRQAWFGDATGLYQVEGGIEGTPYLPALPAFTLPLKSAKQFTWQGSGPKPTGGRGQMRAECDVLPPQNVDLADGVVSAVPITTRMNYPGGETVSTSWFQPGVGLVRLHQETKTKGLRYLTILTLTSHTTGSQ